MKKGLFGPLDFCHFELSEKSRAYARDSSLRSE